MPVVEGELTGKEKATWICPKILGFNPSERWGHSACYCDGTVYVFGGCCGGKHFSDVLVLDTETLAWSTLVTVGYGPGPRDSHTSVLVGQKMMVFGGTNGSKKVNDLHVLDLRFKEWAIPDFTGSPPSPRESHSAALIGDENLVIFGGSGEGDGIYLNDLYILQTKTMRWSSPEVRGDVPVPRDSHSAIAIGRKMFVYGGDSGDRCHGDVHVFDLDTLIWTRLAIPGALPGFRAGHAAFSMGLKVFVVGGVGDKNYYADVWVLDLSCRLWNKIEICGKEPRGRFSHTAWLCNSDVFIYGGCGEDDRPLNELLVLRINSGHRVSSCKVFGNHLKYTDESPSSKRASFINSKRRRTHTHTHTHVLEAEERSFSRSRNSSPSQSEQEPAPQIENARKSSGGSHGFASLHQRSPYLTNSRNHIARDFHIPGGRFMKHPICSEPFIHLAPHTHTTCQQEVDTISSDAGPTGNLIGAEVHGKVDGMFDSGFLMTAMVNGTLFRGILFSPVPSLGHEAPQANNFNHLIPLPFTDAPPLVHGSMQTQGKETSDLEGVVLTLASPGVHHQQN